MSGQSGVLINGPSKPRPRASLPRYCDKMARNRFHREQQILNSSHSLNSSDSFETDDSSSETSSSELSSVIPEANLPPELLQKPEGSRTNLPENNSAKEKRQNLKKSTNSLEKIDNNSIKEKNQNLKKSTKTLKKIDSGQSCSVITFVILGSIILSFVAYMYLPNADEFIRNEESRKKEILKHLEDEIRQLKKEFQNQEKKIWKEIYSGFSEVISNPMKPSIFVLFADTNDPMNCLASTISELGRKALGSGESLIYKPAQLENDTGGVIETLRSEIPLKKSVIFWDLLSINDEALKAFHNICDRENPLIKEAIYIITVKAEGYIKSQNPLEFIENRLRSNLSGRMDEDSIMPLITRITDGPIISVKPEKNMQCRFKNTLT